MASQLRTSTKGDGRMARFKLNWDIVLIVLFWFLGLVAFGLIYVDCASATQPCNHFFKQQVVAVAPVYAAPIYYQAGRDIEADAIAAKVAKIVIGQMRAELNAPQKQTAPQRSAISQHCAKCHSGPTPKAGIVYDGATSLACVQVTAALRSIAKEEMPKDHKLTPEQKGAVMQELLDLEQPADKPPPLPAPVGQLE